jgi:hypothetical protein
MPATSSTSISVNARLLRKLLRRIGRLLKLNAFLTPSQSSLSLAPQNFPPQQA